MNFASLPPFHYPVSDLSPEQIALRDGRITATRAAKICHESEFGGPLTAYREIKGLDTFKGNARTAFGVMAEAMIAGLHQQRHGVRLVQPGTRVHPELGWLAASLDFVAIDDDGAPHYILECKATSDEKRHLWGRQGSDEVPPGYHIQVAVQMAVWDIDEAFMSLLIGQEFREFRIKRDAKFERDIIAQLERFWLDHIIANVPPTDAAERLYLETVYTRYDGEVRDCTDDPEVEALASELREIRRRERELVEERVAAENALIREIGSCEAVVTTLGTISWRKEGRSKERVLRVPRAWTAVEKGEEAHV